MKRAIVIIVPLLDIDTNSSYLPEKIEKKKRKKESATGGGGWGWEKKGWSVAERRSFLSGCNSVRGKGRRRGSCYRHQSTKEVRQLARQEPLQQILPSDKHLSV